MSWMKSWTYGGEYVVLDEKHNIIPNDVLCPECWLIGEVWRCPCVCEFTGRAPIPFSEVWGI